LTKYLKLKAGFASMFAIRQDAFLHQKLNKVILGAFFSPVVEFPPKWITVPRPVIYETA
jgi:hypothetical protein